MAELKTCPFCGGEVKMFAGMIAGVSMIVCTGCRATVSFGGHESAAETVSAYNRRKGCNRKEKGSKNNGCWITCGECANTACPNRDETEVKPDA